MLTAFDSFRSQKTVEPTSTTESSSSCVDAYTIFLYTRASIPFTVEMPDGPGGIITLTDEECAKILRETDIQMYIGASGAELKFEHIQNSTIYHDILHRHQDELGRGKGKSPKPI